MKMNIFGVNIIPLKHTNIHQAVYVNATWLGHLEQLSIELDHIISKPRIRLALLKAWRNRCSLKARGLHDNVYIANLDRVWEHHKHSPALKHQSQGESWGWVTFYDTKGTNSQGRSRYFIRRARGWTNLEIKRSKVTNRTIPHIPV